MQKNLNFISDNKIQSMNIKSYSIKSNLIFFTSILKNKLKKNILFIFPKTSNEQTQFFIKNLSLNNFLVLSKWSEGLITNYHQMSKSYKNIHNYNFLTKIDLTSIDYVVLGDMPEKNSSMYNELLILKTNFGIKIISFVNIDFKTENINSLIDIPLYYTNSNDNIFYPQLNFLYFYLLSFLIK